MGSIKKLKDLYDSHFEIEIIQLLIKLFTLELKDNDPMKLAYEIRAIFHDIDATGVKVDIQLIAFIKYLYPSYTHYLESLQASGQIKTMTLKNLLTNLQGERNHLGRRSLIPMKKLCVLHRKDTNQKKNLQRMKIEAEVEVEDKEDSIEEGGGEI